MKVNNQKAFFTSEHLPQHQFFASKILPGSGSIEFEEFLKMMTQKILNRDPKDEILKAFRLFDDDETGKLFD